MSYRGRGGNRGSTSFGFDSGSSENSWRRRDAKASQGVSGSSENSWRSQNVGTSDGDRESSQIFWRRKNNNLSLPVSESSDNCWRIQKSIPLHLDGDGESSGNSSADDSGVPSPQFGQPVYVNSSHINVAKPNYVSRIRGGSRGRGFSNTNHRENRSSCHLGFDTLHRLLINEELDSEAVIMALHLQLQEWEDLMSEKFEQEISDELFIVIIQLLAEKVCVDSILQSNQLEIISRTFGKMFGKKLIEICTRMYQPEKHGSDQSSVSAEENNATTSKVDHSRTQFLRKLHTFFSFTLWKIPTTAVDVVSHHVIFVLGCISFGLDSSDDSVTEIRDDFRDLQKSISSLIKKKEETEIKKKRFDKYGFTKREEEILHDMLPPDNFRYISIIPSIDEILSTEETFLRTNKTEGAYHDADHYLDVQFRLLREDFLQPLRRGIQDLLRNRNEYTATTKRKMPNSSVRIYYDVRVTNVQLIGDTLTYGLQLSPTVYNKIKWETSKRLLNGSLLVLTSDNFRKVFFGVVARREAKELKHGSFGVYWEGSVPVLDDNITYMMIECEGYFEAYRHILEALQELRLETFPLKKFIVDGSTDVCAPQYLQQNIECKMVIGGGGKAFSPLTEPWPTAEALKMDETQFEAFRAALTKEFAIIQGPPGTGKTFLGLQIAEALLRNQNLWRGSHGFDSGAGPILIVCYTNHALDQFLEGILKIMRLNRLRGLIRVGGRCKSKELEAYTLSERRRLTRFDDWFKEERRNAFDEVRNAEEYRGQLISDVRKLGCPEGIIKFRSLTPVVRHKIRSEYSAALLDFMEKETWFGITEFQFENLYFSEQDILNRWFNITNAPCAPVDKLMQRNQLNINTIRDVNHSDDEGEFDLDELLEHRILSTIQNETGRADILVTSQLEYLPGTSIRELSSKHSTTTREIHKIREDDKMSAHNKFVAEKDLANQLRILGNRLRLLESIFHAYRNGLLHLPDAKQILQLSTSAQNVFTYFKRLRFSQKWALYFHLLEKARSFTILATKTAEDELIYSRKSLNEIRRFGDVQVLREAVVVGMTTSGAAKNRDLVQRMKSKIVIVEEAAEVLESHIVTSISRHCQHLILIGDHQQLRPSTTVYELSKKYNLDISLFERMLNNNLNCYKLKVQHRMRPEICNLVFKTIYDELENHPSVHEYPDVKGTTKNLFFVTHKQHEAADSESMSKSNIHEAKFLASLCKYFMQQGYTPDQVTVLTTYTGQMFLLKNQIAQFPMCEGVRVTVVDNFQGEENDIILLSLVRSNEENQIGFLKTDNRVCVAITRAKHGLFISGNLDMLASRSSTWTQIKEKLNSRDESGPKLNLICQIHGTLTEVEDYTDFGRVPQGGCGQICNTSLNCGHDCKSICHIKDRDHKDYICLFSCEKYCVNQHRCKQKCFQKCPPCPVLMDKTLPCLHIERMRCHEPENDVLCMVQVERHLPCGHTTELACHVDPLTYSCRIKVTKILPCLHEKTDVQCWIELKSISCKVVVKKSLVPCGHLQDTRCHILPEMAICETIVLKDFPQCGHQIHLQCHKQRNSKLSCIIPCEIDLSCGHRCTKTCHVFDDPSHLEYSCRKSCERSCPEGHACSSRHLCCVQCPPCRAPVEKILKCGVHKRNLDCGQGVRNVDCKSPCEFKFTRCGHKCQKVCFESCGPCQVNVVKSAPCGHEQEVQCSAVASQDNCDALVEPLCRPSCGHEGVLVPCKVANTILPSDATTHCRSPCELNFENRDPRLGCRHSCTGTCSECQQGRLHKKCVEICGKILVCGHKCTFLCFPGGCPPCQDKCESKCLGDHSSCKNKCSDPCTRCTEKCEWECQHEKCNKLCWEPCDRPACEHPCSKKLQLCGHDCIGFCGEPCPSLCRLCNKEELAEILVVVEQKENTRYVQLEDCKHCFESTWLDRYMLQPADEELITPRVCPKCHSVIRRSRRYGNIIRQHLKDIVDIKKKVLWDRRAFPKLQRNLINEVKYKKEWMTNLPNVRDFILKKLAHIVLESKNQNPRAPKIEKVINLKVDKDTVASIELIAEHARDVMKIIRDVTVPLKGDQLTNLKECYDELFQSLIERELPLSCNEVRDFDREFDRIFHVKELYLRKSFAKLSRNEIVFQSLCDEAVTAVELLLGPEVYTNETMDSIKELLNRIDENLSTGLNNLDRQRRDFLTTFVGMDVGAWSKCPNGHIYPIKMEDTTEALKCDECQRAINAQIEVDNNSLLMQENRNSVTAGGTSTDNNEKLKQKNGNSLAVELTGSSSNVLSQGSGKIETENKQHEKDDFSGDEETRTETNFVPGHDKLGGQNQQSVPLSSFLQEVDKNKDMCGKEDVDKIFVLRQSEGKHDESLGKEIGTDNDRFLKQNQNNISTGEGAGEGNILATRQNENGLHSEDTTVGNKVLQNQSENNDSADQEIGAQIDNHFQPLSGEKTADENNCFLNYDLKNELAEL